MDTFSIIQGIHFSLCSDAGKGYYIINTLYNAINILCHKSASCLLGLPTSGIWALRLNRTSLFHLQQGRRVYICFPLTLGNTLGPHAASIRFTFSSILCTRQAYISFLHASKTLVAQFYQNLDDKVVLTSFPVRFTFIPPVPLLANKATTLFFWPGPAPHPTPLLLQSLDNQFTLTWPG